MNRQDLCKTFIKIQEKNTFILWLLISKIYMAKKCCLYKTNLHHKHNYYVGTTNNETL